jgi:hypothetical protein
VHHPYSPFFTLSLLLVTFHSCVLFFIILLVFILGLYFTYVSLFFWQIDGNVLINRKHSYLFKSNYIKILLHIIWLKTPREMELEINLGLNSCISLNFWWIIYANVKNSPFHISIDFRQKLYMKSLLLQNIFTGRKHEYVVCFLGGKETKIVLLEMKYKLLWHSMLWLGLCAG